MIAPFAFAATPHVHFGAGSRNRLPELAAEYGSRTLLVTGGSSFDASPQCRDLEAQLHARLEVRRIRVAGEPSPDLVDEIVATHHGFAPASVIAVGGGSAMDAAKAIAGLIASGDSVMEYLEGVGRGRRYRGPSVPFLAAPTTAGTGGETSKNAVLSRIGRNGFKKSFRDERLVARHIVLDPELGLGCPPKVTAACGMDALTQLLESYVSTGANPLTDALAREGLSLLRQALPRVVENGQDLEARGAMLLAASISGLTLANAGLGAVHGLASPLGALFPVPHGVVCGTLLYTVTRANLQALQGRMPTSPALARYAEAGRILCGAVDGRDDERAREALLSLLSEWEQRFGMPRLREYGVRETDLARIAAQARGNSMKTNPVELRDEELVEILRQRL